MMSARQPRAFSDSADRAGATAGRRPRTCPGGSGWVDYARFERPSAQASMTARTAASSSRREGALLRLFAIASPVRRRTTKATVYIRALAPATRGGQEQRTRLPFSLWTYPSRSGSAPSVGAHRARARSLTASPLGGVSSVHLTVTSRAPAATYTTLPGSVVRLENLSIPG